MTKIEWTDQTWNPTTGCEKISAGCQNCYAEIMHRRLRGMGHEKYKGLFNVPRCWPDELKRNFGKKPKKIFVNSMGDLFHSDISTYFIYHVMEVIEENPQHIFQILTKRPERIGCAILPDNVWLGVTIEDNSQIKRIEYLKRANVKVKFISFEPLLEYMEIIDITGIDWVIVGAETGPGARYMQIGWARNIMLQCHFLRVPFFFKKVSKGDSIPDDLNIRQFPEAK